MLTTTTAKMETNEDEDAEDAGVGAVCVGGGLVLVLLVRKISPMNPMVK